MLFPFLSLTPPPPTGSTLFPYTTLFRSRVYPILMKRLYILLIAFLLAMEAKAVAQDEDYYFGVRWSVNGTPSALSIDRKSTRLNSSHVAISYAVFCLKKKKHKTNEQ